MLVDARTYTVVPAELPAYLERVEEVGLPLQSKYGYQLAGYFTVETGQLNRVVHYWKWQNAGERQEKRRALNADPEWVEFRKSNAHVFTAQENRLLTATDVVEPFAFKGNGSKLGFVDERTYTITYGQVPQCVALTKKLAWPIIQRAGWQLIGYFASVTGTINQVVHLWYWDSQAQREERQAKAVADPDWPVYQSANGQRMLRQENRYLEPTHFSPIR
jgi:hypothetical protein